MWKNKNIQAVFWRKTRALQKGLLWSLPGPCLGISRALISYGFQGWSSGFLGFYTSLNHSILFSINLLYWFHRKRYSLATLDCSLSFIDCIPRFLKSSFLFACLFGAAKCLHASDCSLFLLQMQAISCCLFTRFAA